MKPHNRTLRYELAQSAIAGAVRFIPSSGMVGEGDYRMCTETTKDIARKAVALADAVLDELDKEQL